MQTPTQRRADPLVTGIHDRWADQGLTGEPWPFMALCSLGRLNQILSRALETELKSFELSRTGYFLLTTLALMTGGRARLSTLGRLLMVHPTTVTLTVDQLERSGLVERHRQPEDRRATLVQITEAGRDTARRANEALGAATEEIGRAHV